MIDEPACDRAEVGVRVFDNGFEYGGGAFFSFGSEGMVALHNRPAVITTRLNIVNAFPKILADLATP